LNVSSALIDYWGSTNLTISGTGRTLLTGPNTYSNTT
jgi:hypothetical protein